MKLREVFELLPEFDEDKCVLIAEKFAVQFARWINDNYIVSTDGLWIELGTFGTMNKKNTRQLLEIFKTEYFN